jgi:DNA-binding response OmpR family regulator
MTTTAPTTTASVLVVGDDLLWATRLASQAGRAGATARIVRDVAALEASVSEAPPRIVIVDLASRAFDGVAAIESAARYGLAVIAVAQHEDHALRKRALAVGARRVYAYGKMHADGVEILHEWLR